MFAGVARQYNGTVDRVEEISRLVGPSSSSVTETIYRHQIRPVITTGAEAMDKVFSNE